MMAALRTVFTAASATGLLPWLLLAGATLLGTTASGAFWAGHHWAASSCDGEKLESQIAAQQHQAAAVAKAQATSDKIWSIGIELTVDLAVAKERAQSRTNEVIRYVDASPDLGRSLVPAGLQRLRDDQVRESERLAAGADPVRR